MLLVISTSLNPASRSRLMARSAFQSARSACALQSNEPEAGENAAVQFLDLQQFDLPFCNAADCYAHPEVSQVAEQIGRADAVLMASAVYNFDVSASAKNLVELTGKNCWSGKLVGFLLAAGGQGSYMSAMPFANSLMLDFRCLVLPKFVYATGDAFDDQRIVDEDITQRLAELSHLAIKLAPLWKSCAEH